MLDHSVSPTVANWEMSSIQYVKQFFGLDKLHSFSRIWQWLNEFFTALYSQHIIPLNYSMIPKGFFLLGNFYSLYIFSYGIILSFCHKNTIIFLIFAKEFAKNLFFILLGNSVFACILEICFLKKIMIQIHMLTGRNKFENRINYATHWQPMQIMRNKSNWRWQDAGETKLKVEGEGERERVGKGNERHKLFNFNDAEAVNVHIT